MKKHQISALISRFATPAVLILLGLVLIFCPDMASALISKVAGWGLMMAGIVIAVAMVVDGNWSLSKILTILVLVGLGRWFMSHPLAWAAWGGRIVGLFVLLRGIRDFTQSVLAQGKALSAVTAVLGFFDPVAADSSSNPCDLCAARAYCCYRERGTTCRDSRRRN